MLNLFTAQFEWVVYFEVFVLIPFVSYIAHSVFLPLLLTSFHPSLWKYFAYILATVWPKSFAFLTRIFVPRKIKERSDKKNELWLGKRKSDIEGRYQKGYFKSCHCFSFPIRLKVFLSVSLEMIVHWFSILYSTEIRIFLYCKVVCLI
jgi:hypothetical protein